MRARHTEARSGTAARRLPIIVLLSALSLFATAAHAAAQEQVLLAEVMPELAGSDLGAIPVANAPATGSVLVVRENDVRRALDRAHQSADGLAIPKSTRVSRKLVELSADALIDEQRQAIDAAANPCSIDQITGPKRVTLLEGPHDARVELPGSRRTGQMSGVVIVTRGARTVRVPIMLRLSCPEPEISVGKLVKIVVRVGNVRVSTLGEARQIGRTGEIIRVTNRATAASLRARVIDAQTVEVVQ